MKIKTNFLKQSFFVILLLLGLSSCFHLYFDQPQPKKGIKLTTVPVELQGRWFRDNDTSYIDENGLFNYDFDSIKGKFIKDRYALSDSILLFKSGDYYVLNFKDKSWWEVVIIERKRNGDIYFYYPSTAPYFGKSFGLRVHKIDQHFGSIWINDSVARDRHILFKKRLSLKKGISRKAVYYKGQFRIKDIKKVTIPENVLWIFKNDGTIENPIKMTYVNSVESDSL
jgi:hypothetical protein